MLNSAMLSSKSVEWSTPKDLFDDLDFVYRFNLDVCATAENAKCERYFTREQDGLSQSWAGARVWCNPPYGREIKAWVGRCATAALPSPAAPALAVCLVPARTDTSWWHEYIIPHGRVTFLRGRLKFGGATNSAPFPSAVVVFGPPA